MSYSTQLTRKVVKATTKRNCLGNWEEGVQFESQRGTSEIHGKEESRSSSRLGSSLWEIEGPESSQWALSIAQPQGTVSDTKELLFFALSLRPYRKNQLTP